MTTPRRQLLVVAALIRHQGRILLSQRRLDQSFPLCWEFPGGKVSPGELPESALAREIREELGCEVRVGRIFEVVLHAYDAFDLLMQVHECEVVSGTPAAVQVAAVRWFSPGDIPGLPLPPADYPLARTLAAESAPASGPLAPVRRGEG
jgi:8-oxo-dGTP diphosphatase